jgi:deoxyribonuclease V
VQIHRFHSWDVTPSEASQIQERLRTKVISHGLVSHPRLVAGADIALGKHANRLYVCVVVLAFPGLDIVETVAHEDRTLFPYIPGLLSFRETPALLRAFMQLKSDPDVIFIDGHGLSHPRSAGIACHVGVLLDRPTIGCAKSVLVGTYKDPASSRCSVSDLRDRDGHVIGAAVRTRAHVKPVYVSIGHRISLAQAVKLTLACGKGYRIPEPTRLADLLAGRAKRDRE